MSELRVTDAESFGRFARDLRTAGRKDLRREMFKGIQRAAKPLKAAAPQAALDELPARGGLAARVAASKWSVRTRAGRDPGIRVTGSSDLDLRSLNRGRLRHLTFGHRPWENQAVPVGWFDRKMTEAADKYVRAEILAAISAVIRKLEAGG